MLFMDLRNFSGVAEREGKGREGNGREGKGKEGKGREGKGRGGKGKEGKGREGLYIRASHGSQKFLLEWEII